MTYKIDGNLTKKVHDLYPEQKLTRKTKYWKVVNSQIYKSLTQFLLKSPKEFLADTNKIILKFI